MNALTETRLLLDALRHGQTAQGWSAACAQAGIHWDNLAVRAIVLGLAPQLQQKLMEWGLTTAIPARAAAKLAVTYQAQAKRSAAIFDQLAEVLESCAAAGLRPIALKGIHLAALVYPHPALRPMNDIDLLFTSDELPRAEAVLQSLGYGGKHRPAGFGPGVVKHTSTFQRAGVASTPNPYLSPEAERMIEPHISLEESWFGLRVDVTPGMRERAVDVELAGRPGRVLEREDLLLHLCVHFCFHFIAGSPAMVQLLDLKAVAATDHLRWPVFVERAAERRAAPYALAALSLAQRLLDAPTGHVLAELARAAPSHIRRRIDRLGLEDLLGRTQQKPLTTVAGRLRRGLSDRVEAARWAVDWRTRWQVWRTALDFTHTDTGQLIWRTFVAKSRNK